jgi:hypothetical protein
LLGEFQSPLIERSHGVGDLAFGTRQDGVLLFARGNLVYLLRNLGSRRVSVRNAGLALDAHATSTPSQVQRIAPQHAFARGGTDTEIVKVTLYDAGGDNRPEGVCRKFVVPEGEVRVTGQSIIYRGRRAGLSALAVYECSNED